MFAVVDRVMSFCSMKVGESKCTHTEPSCIYTERIKCFEKLAELQKKMKAADKDTSAVLVIEQSADKNAHSSVETYTTEYRKEYELCEKIMKY